MAFDPASSSASSPCLIFETNAAEFIRIQSLASRRMVKKTRAGIILMILMGIGAFTAMSITNLFIPNGPNGLLYLISLLIILYVVFLIYVILIRYRIKRIYETIPNFNRVKMWVESGYWMTEHGITRIGFQLSQLEELSASGDEIHLFFTNSGVCRIPGRAFPSRQGMLDFVAWVNLIIDQNTRISPNPNYP